MTKDEIIEMAKQAGFDPHDMRQQSARRDGVEWATKQLKEKNT